MPKIQLRHDTAANWTTANPTLLAGEAGIETDTGKFKLGNGTDNWTTLAYAQSDATDIEAELALKQDKITPNVGVDLVTQSQTILLGLPFANSNGGSGDTTHSFDLNMRKSGGAQIYAVIEQNNTLYFNSNSGSTLNTFYYKTFTSSSNTSNIFSNKKVLIEIITAASNTITQIVSVSSASYYIAPQDGVENLQDINVTYNETPQGNNKVIAIEMDLRGKTCYGIRLNFSVNAVSNNGIIYRINIRDAINKQTLLNVIPATSSVIGGVKPDGTTTTVDTNGTITAVTDPGGTIQTQINGLQTGLTSLQTEVTTLSGNVSTITTEFSALDSRVDATESSIETINTNLGGLKFVALTQAEYDALTTKDTNTVYIIKEATS